MFSKPFTVEEIKYSTGRQNRRPWTSDNDANYINYNTPYSITATNFPTKSYQIFHNYYFISIIIAQQQHIFLFFRIILFVTIMCRTIGLSFRRDLWNRYVFTSTHRHTYITRDLFRANQMYNGDDGDHVS